MHEIFLFVMNIIIIIRFITLRSLILFYINYVGHITLVPYVSKLIQLKKSCFFFNKFDLFKRKSFQSLNKEKNVQK